MLTENPPRQHHSCSSNLGKNRKEIKSVFPVVASAVRMVMVKSKLISLRLCNAWLYCEIPKEKCKHIRLKSLSKGFSSEYECCKPRLRRQSYKDRIRWNTVQKINSESITAEDVSEPFRFGSKAVHYFWFVNFNESPVVSPKDKPFISAFIAVELSVD